MPSIHKATRGVCQTDYGFVVHWKTLDESSAWDVMQNFDLDETHYVKLYTSAVLKAKGPDSREKRQQINDIVDAIGGLETYNVNPLGIESVA